MVRLTASVCHLIAAVEQQVLGGWKIAERPIQPRGLLHSAAAEAEGLALDDQQVDIGIRARIAAGAGAEQDDRLRVGLADDDLDQATQQLGLTQPGLFQAKGVHWCCTSSGP